MFIIAGLFGILSACGEHGHEESSDDGEKKKEYIRSHD